MHDLEPERVLYDGIDRKLFPEYDKAVKLIIEGKPALDGRIMEIHGVERFYRLFSRGPAYAGTWGIVLWGFPFSLFIYWLALDPFDVVALVIYLLVGFLFGYTMWHISLKHAQKYLSDYVAYYEKTQVQPSPVTVAYQSNQPQISSDDKYAQLDKISQLKKRGVLTEQEFEIEKRKILK